MPNIINICSFEDEALQIYRNCNEAQLLHYFEPNGGLFIAESPMVVERALDTGYRPFSMLIDERLLKTANNADITQLLARCGDIPIYCGNETLLGQLTGYKLTRGMLCAMYRKALPAVGEICENASRIAVLYDVENPTNVGAIFRNAAALGIDAVLLTRSSSDPLYRRSLRVSLGTALMLPWTIFETVQNPFPSSTNKHDLETTATDCIDGSGKDSGTCIDMLRRLGFTTVAMALCENAVTPDDPVLKNCGKAAIILGNEGFGLPEEVIAECDHTVMIPMQNGVDSLNVAAASAIAFWEFVKGLSD
ncbi:MAG: RNA methyltransferase [Lachnospiraceae bacterium]|nr:RNA methyltransferase [Lachnospiraceae bacterium]